MMKKITSLFVLLSTAVGLHAQTLTVTVTPTNPTTCNGTGSASVAVSGCAGPYTYTVDGGSPQSAPTSPFTIPNLAVGAHTVNVTTTGGSSGAIFTDNFENGSASWALNTSAGTQGAQPNQWVINSLSPYTGGCDPGSGSNSLHIACNGGLLCQIFGAVADYNETSATNASNTFCATANNLNTVGRTNLQLKFAWQCVGDPGDDYGNVRYSINGGTNWIDLPTEYSNNGSWTCATVSLPATCENITTLKIGFRWQNSGDNFGAGPSFNIDNVVLDGAGGGSGACAGSATFNISGGSGTFTPTTNVTGTQTICDGDDITITATTGQNCTWNTVPQQSGQSIIVSEAGTYICTCQDQTSNCSGPSAPVTVTLAPPPTGGFSYNQIDNYTVNFTSTSTGGTTFDWIFPNAPLTGSGATIEHDFPSEGNYTVSLVVSSDCGVDTVTQTVVVLKVGIDENDIFAKFDLFPNPAQNQVMLQLNTVKPFEGTVKIVTPLGQIVSEEVIKFASTLNKTIATSNLANGIYSIIITTEGKNFARRLVINN